MDRSNWYDSLLVLFWMIKDYKSVFSLNFSDGTNNYIKGQDERDAENLKNKDIVPRGLPVVTVLIGVFSKKTG